jgi:hypothetical protein
MRSARITLAAAATGVIAIGVASGIAAPTSAPSTAGTHPQRVSYASTVPTRVEVPTQTTLHQTPSPSAPGGQVTFTAMVTLAKVSSTSLAAPQYGSVDFSVAALRPDTGHYTHSVDIPKCQNLTLDKRSQATCTVVAPGRPGLPKLAGRFGVSKYTARVTAVYSAQTSYGSSHDSVNHTVEAGRPASGSKAAPTTTELAQSSSRSEPGQQVTFTASVQAAGAAKPDGSVDFSIAAQKSDGSYTRFYTPRTKCQDVSLSSAGQATCTVSTPRKIHRSYTAKIRARYSGDAGYGPSTSGSVTHTVSK